MPLTRAFLFSWRLAVIRVVRIGLVPVGWYLGSPRFITRTVTEAVPADHRGIDAPLPTAIAERSFGEER